MNSRRRLREIVGDRLTDMNLDPADISRAIGLQRNGLDRVIRRGQALPLRCVTKLCSRLKMDENQLIQLALGQYHGPAEMEIINSYLRASTSSRDAELKSAVIEARQKNMESRKRVSKEC